MSKPQGSADDFSTEFEAAFARLQVTMLEACGREELWPRKIAAGVRAGFEFAAADPDAARMLASEALAHGREGVARHERLVAYLGERLLPGRDESADGPRLPESTERAMAGGALALVGQRLDRGRVDELVALVPEAVQFVLTPYIGAEDARRVAGEVLSGGPAKWPKNP